MDGPIVDGVVFKDKSVSRLQVPTDRPPHPTETVS